MHPVIDNKPNEVTAPTTNPEQPSPVKRRVRRPWEIGGGAAHKPKRVNKYDALVKENMAKNSIKSLAEASKYIKEHKIYVSSKS